MTKYTVHITRTYTYHTQITAENEDQASIQVDRLISGLSLQDFHPAFVDKASLDTLYQCECTDCHNAEAFADLPWCQSCARKNHPTHFLGYLRGANKRMQTTNNCCKRCGVFHFGCQYYDHVRFGLGIYCAECLVFVAKPGEKEFQV